MLGDMLVGNVSVEILEDIFGTLGSMWHATYCGLSGNFPGNIFVQDVQLLSKMCLFFSKTYTGRGIQGGRRRPQATHPALREGHPPNGRMGLRGGHGLPKVSSGPTLVNPSIL
jgi:hypothetical protein